MRATSLLALLLFAAAPAFAQYYDYDSSWNATGPKPLPCFYNGHKYFPSDSVCVRKGMAQVCESDGSLGPATADADCTSGVTPSRSFSEGATPRGLPVCRFGHEKFAVGAEICTSAGTAQTCKADGDLSTAKTEPACL